jgi:competence ComEA-like helix-hairpin-helix protein
MKQLAFFSAFSDKSVDKPLASKEKPKTETVNVNINTASMDDLISLPGIGKATAKKIIDNRPYKSLEDLEKVPGIGEKKLKKLSGLITIN